MKLQGTMTALITPFRHGELDEPALRKIIKRQIAAGISGLIPCGSTGEAATLHPDEWRRVIEINTPQLSSGDPNLIYPSEQIVLPPIDNGGNT